MGAGTFTLECASFAGVDLIGGGIASHHCFGASNVGDGNGESFGDAGKLSR